MELSHFEVSSRKQFAIKTYQFYNLYILHLIEFLRIFEIRIENFTKHEHLYKQSSIRSLKSLKKEITQ